MNKFIYQLLNKKVNKRICNFSKLKQTQFLEGFSWDDFIDFRIKPPYIPNCEDYSENLTNTLELYETFNSIKVNIKLNFIRRKIQQKRKKVL